MKDGGRRFRTTGRLRNPTFFGNPFASDVTTFGMKLHNFQVLRIPPPQQNTLHTPQCTNAHPPPPSFPPVTTITILKSSPTCLITQFPHRKSQNRSESSTSKLRQTCETPRPLSAMSHLSLFKTSRTNEMRYMCHPARNKPTW